MSLRRSDLIENLILDTLDPSTPPLVPGQRGAPSYDECAGMLLMLGVYDVLGTPLPPALAQRLGPWEPWLREWESRLREWGRREVERGNLDKLLAAGS